MQYEVDSYVLEYDEEEEKYYISFTDSVQNKCKMEINRDIFDVYRKSKKAYIKIKNETSRHIEQSTLTEEEVYNKTFNPVETVEEIAIRNVQKEKIRQSLEELTDAQYRRIHLHIISEITIRDVAKIEKVQKRQIEKSLRLGLKKIKKFFEK